MTMCRWAGVAGTVDGGSSIIISCGTHGESLELRIHFIAYAPRIGHTSQLTAKIFNGSLLNKNKDADVTDSIACVQLGLMFDAHFLKHQLPGVYNYVYTLRVMVGVVCNYIKIDIWTYNAQNFIAIFQRFSDLSFLA